MLSSVLKRLLFLVATMLLCITIQVFLFAGGSFFRAEPSQLARSSQLSNSSASAPTANPTLTPTSTKATTKYQRPDFETGLVFPQWSQTSYGPSDTVWQQGIVDIQAQTGARWIEMPLLFSQTSPTTTVITIGQSTPTVEAFAAGIRAAHALGFHVFMVPLFGVVGPGTWAASIHFSTYAQEQQWFDNFWQVFQPYVAIANITGVEQLSIGTEEVWLQENAPSSLWNTLITRVRSIYSGTITYDMNWSTLADPPPAWMSNPNLAMIGVSEYIPLTDVRERIDPVVMIPLWRDKVKVQLDNLSIRLGKPVLISEIGYRNSADALYHSWYPTSTVSPPDPIEQAAACDAALANVIPDPHVAGIFFWGWDDVGGFKLSGQPALKVISKWFTSPLS